MRFLLYRPLQNVFNSIHSLHLYSSYNSICKKFNIFIKDNSLATIVLLCFIQKQCLWLKLMVETIKESSFAPCFAIRHILRNQFPIPECFFQPSCFLLYWNPCCRKGSCMFLRAYSYLRGVVASGPWALFIGF